MKNLINFKIVQPSTIILVIILISQSIFFLFEDNYNRIFILILIWIALIEYFWYAKNILSRAKEIANVAETHIDESRETFEKMSNQLDWFHSQFPKLLALEEKINEKKKKFLNIPSTNFHYIDEPRLRGFYNDYFKEPVNEHFTSELIIEHKHNIFFNLLRKSFGFKHEDKDGKKLTSNYKRAELSSSGAFIKYLRSTIEKGEVLLGIEDLEIELTSIEEFEKKVFEFEKNYNIKLDEEKVKDTINNLSENSVKLALQKLEHLSGWVLIEGNFEITEDLELYVLKMRHPINDYTKLYDIEIETSFPQKDINLSMAGNYRRSLGQKVNCRVYGEVFQTISKTASTRNIKITPLAIY